VSNRIHVVSFVQCFNEFIVLSFLVVVVNRSAAAICVRWSSDTASDTVDDDYNIESTTTTTTTTRSNDVSETEFDDPDMATIIC